MKIFYALIILILLQNCSFDNKSGIWKNENFISKEDTLFEEFKTISNANETFNKIIPIKKNFKFFLGDQIKNTNWSDIFFNQTNNYKNFKYNDKNQLIFKSKKLSKSKINNYVIVENNNLITSDHKGNLIVFSINQNKITSKYNFYKKKFKKIKKKLNLIVENNIIYVSDNIGYLYAFNYESNKILWAKNFKVPFRSNLKLSKKKLITSNQNNKLFFINKINGEMIKLIPTEETTVKNLFVNNLSANTDNIFFLNTYGSLYSININSMEISWFLNLNQSLDLNPSNLFFGSEIINFEDKIAVSSNEFMYIINANNGSTIYKKNIPTVIKPIIINNYLFAITKNDYLISMNLRNGDIIYSYNINTKISEFLDTKKKKVEFKDMLIANDHIYIFLRNSFLLKFNIRGELISIDKFSSKIYSQLVLVNNSLLYLDNKNKISIID